MTYKKYLRKYHIGDVGDLEEKNGFFTFHWNGPMALSWNVNEIASSKIIMVEDDFVGVTVWNDGNETPHSCGAHSKLIPLSSFVFSGPYEM